LIASQERHLAQARRATALPRRLLGEIQRSTALSAGGAGALALAILLWGIGRWVAGTPLYLMAYGSVILIAIAWVASRRPLAVLGVRSTVRPRVREGEAINVVVTLTAQRPVSNLLLEERLPAELGQTALLPVARLTPKEEFSTEYQVTCWRRGAYRIGPLVARYGDPVGLTIREQEIAGEFEVLVHPAVERVSDRPLTRQFEDPPIRPPVSKPWPSGLEFYGMRDFRPGDDLRRIVWRAVARTGRIMVREAEQGITDRITLVVNTNRAGYDSAADFSPAFETAVRAAASLGVRHLADGYAVTVEVNRGRLTVPLRGGRTQLELLDALARLTMDREPLAGALRRLIANNQRDAHNVLITPTLTREEAGQLRVLLEKGVSVLAVVLAYREGFEEAAHNAAAVGCQVVEVRPNVSLAEALATEVGAGRRR
jgi:uncharacterized protein (DUF58 family)